MKTLQSQFSIFFLSSIWRSSVSSEAEIELWWRKIIWSRSKLTIRWGSQGWGDKRQSEDENSLHVGQMILTSVSDTIYTQSCNQQVSGAQASLLHLFVFSDERLKKTLTSRSTPDKCQWPGRGYLKIPKIVRNECTLYFDGDSRTVFSCLSVWLLLTLRLLFYYVSLILHLIRSFQ